MGVTAAILALALVDAVHGLVNAGDVLFRRQANQAGFAGQLDIDAEAVGIQAGLGDQQYGEQHQCGSESALDAQATDQIPHNRCTLLL